MATFDDVLGGMRLLSQYEYGESSVKARHHRVYVRGPSPSELPEEEVKELSELGWFWDDKFGSWLQFT